MGDYGIKVAKEGKSVFSTDPRDYNLWSKYKVLKVDMSGGGTIDVAENDSEIVTINHNLGYNPLVLFYWGIASNNDKKIARTVIGVSTDGAWFQNDATDKDNVYITFYAMTPGGNKTFDYYYYLLYDEGINA